MADVDVLVIDDDEGIRWVVKEILAMGNISHYIAATGREGIAYFSENKAKLAIIDVKLGAMSGVEVARRIYAINSQIKIIFITGYRSVIEGRLDAELPVLGVIEKPFSIEDLLERVKEAL